MLAIGPGSGRLYEAGVCASVATEWTEVGPGPEAACSLAAQ